MFKKAWYIVMAWTIASFYFLVLAGVIISIFSPGPTHDEVMNWMQGMMTAMHSSLMGWSMGNHEGLNALLTKTSSLTFPAIFAGAVIGTLLKLRGLRNER